MLRVQTNQRLSGKKYVVGRGMINSSKLDLGRLIDWGAGKGQEVFKFHESLYLEMLERKKAWSQLAQR